jgi:hypothetical protein
MYFKNARFKDQILRFDQTFNYILKNHIFKLHILKLLFFKSYVLKPQTQINLNLNLSITQIFTIEKTNS